MSSFSDYPPSYHTNDLSPTLGDQSNDWLTSSQHNYENKEQQGICTFRSGHVPVPVPSHVVKPCRFLQGVVDECRSRFYARALDFFLIEEPDAQNKVYRCLMPECPQDSFNSPHSMLRHLKNCKYFGKGEFICPTCNKTESFRTVSKRRCSWDKIRKVIKSPVNIFRDTIRRSSAPSAPTLTLDVTQGEKKQAQPSIDMPELDSSQFFEAHSELADTKLELEGEVIIFPRNPVPPTSSYQVSSVSQSSEAGYSDDISPTSRTTSSESTSSYDSKYQIPTHTDINGTQVACVNNEFSVDGAGDPYETLTGSWPSQTAELYQMAPVSNPETSDIILNGTSDVLPASLIGQPVFHNERGPPLSIDTENAVPNFNIPIWDRQSFLFDRGTWDYVNSGNGLAVANSQPQPLEVTTLFDAKDFSMPTLPNEPFSPNTEDVASFEFSFPIKTEYPSLSPHESPSSESSDHVVQWKCRHCDFIPTGKRENWKSYLRKHKSTHKDRDTCLCQHCGKSFTRQDNRTAHIRHYHPEHEASLSASPKRRKRSSDSIEATVSKRRKSSTS